MSHFAVDWRHDGLCSPNAALWLPAGPEFCIDVLCLCDEPLRAANLIAQTALYEVVPLSIGGQPVPSSSGFAVPCEDLAGAGTLCHTVFVVAGGNPEDWSEAVALQPFLRRLARQGVRIGGISSGSFILAAAGLLDGRDFTIHWNMRRP